MHRERGLPVVRARALREAWRAVLLHHARAPKRVSVALLTDATMSQLHESYSKIPGTTDVLTFDLKGTPGSYDAEIAIGVEVARRAASDRKLPFEREIQLYLIHGMLHLSGFDDHAKADRARMRRAERKILTFIGHDR
ncbi:MAG: rRNA maturation RNase YbeY [Planctomycetes bacterium]|nr:rRNA maturation RNase YbeY [Planctomycetota bacterium]